MANHTEKETLSYDRTTFYGRTIFPIWQMLQDDEEEEEEEDDDVDGVGVDTNEHNELGTRLTGNVRVRYLNHLEKILIRNYETCCERDRTDWPFSREDLLKCAAWMEYKALRSCMIVMLYQRAMTRLVADIKKHTEQLKIYAKLKHFISFDSGQSTKMTQTCPYVYLIDQETQTDVCEESSFCAGNNESSLDVGRFCNRLSADAVKCECLDVDIGNIDGKCAIEDTSQGVPIPVYVSGISSSGSKSRNTHGVRVIKNIEPVSISKLNMMENIPLLNGVEVISSQNCNIPKEDTNMIMNEPYQWSVIEASNKLKMCSNSSVQEKKLCDRQENTILSNGMFNSNEESEEISKLTIDERIAAVFGFENPEFSEDDEVYSEKCEMEVDEEPSGWSIQKCEHQQLLRAKILEKCVVNIKKRGQMRLRFLELFGSDSDDCFDIEEEVTGYRDKLARWVVVSLMPYYRERRILSRPLFKFLARHIADRLLKTNLWHSESDVMQKVVEFFNSHDIIESEDDIWSHCHKNSRSHNNATRDVH